MAGQVPQLQRLEHADRVRPREHGACLLYTSDAADERSSVDLGGRRIITKKKRLDIQTPLRHNTN